MLQAHLVKSDNPVGFPEPTEALSGHLQDFLVVVPGLPEHLHHGHVRGLADHLSGLVEPEGATEGVCVVHVVHTALHPFVHLGRGHPFARRWVETFGVIVHEFADRPEAAFPVHDLEELGPALGNHPEADRVIHPALHEGILQLLHLGLLEALGLGLAVVTDVPPRVSVDELAVHAGQSRLRHLHEFATHLEKVAFDVAGLVAEILDDLRGILAVHDHG